MGRVYRAEQTTLGRTVAVKIIHPHLVGRRERGARFITEARAASRLNHPNSVGVIDFGKTNRRAALPRDGVPARRDLARVAYEEGPLPFRRIVDVLRRRSRRSRKRTTRSSTAISSPRTSSSSRCAAGATS
jgi:serine/threonine protein kinase